MPAMTLSGSLASSLTPSLTNYMRRKTSAATYDILYKMLKTETNPTFWARIYMSGPIEVAKQIVRQDCLRAGLCVTIEPALFIYTGGKKKDSSSDS